MKNPSEKKVSSFKTSAKKLEVSSMKKIQGGFSRLNTPVKGTTSTKNTAL